MAKIEEGKADGFRTDRYSLTMPDAGRHDGLKVRKAVIEVFARSLPEGRRYGVVAGTGRVLDRLANFRYTDKMLAYLQKNKVVSDDTIVSLANFGFHGDIYGYPEGEVYFPNSPIMTIVAPWFEAVPIEAFVSGIFNSDSATASAASRMVNAAQGRELIEMGSRRVDPDAAPHKARAAYIAGFAGSSNMQAGLEFDVPTMGTNAHLFTLAYEDFEHTTEETELIAFRTLLREHGIGTTLLVDTYNIERGIRNAVKAANELGANGPGRIRIDSGDLDEEAENGKELLLQLGATETEVVLSSDLDEFKIADLVREGTPAKWFGVGERVMLGSGAPTAGFIYKQSEIEIGRETGRMKPTEKTSKGKATHKWRKYAYRELESGIIVREFLTTEPLTKLPPNVEPVQIQMMKNGEVLVPTDADTARNRHSIAMLSLPPEAREITPAEPYLTVQFGSPRPVININAPITPKQYRKAIIVVDPNNDFSIFGTLPVAGADDEYFQMLNARLEGIAREGDTLLIASSDEHIDPGDHWSETPDYKTSFPKHCEKGTWGAEFNKYLNKDLFSEVFYKGNYAAAFSGFEGISRDGTSMEDYLLRHGVEEVEIWGLATDFCDRATAISALKRNFKVTVKMEYCRGVTPEGTLETVRELVGIGIGLE